MKLNYTGTEAIRLLKTVFTSNYEATLSTYKAHLNSIVKIYECSISEAFKVFLKTEPHRVNAIYMLAALQTIENETSAENQNLINTINKLEDEKRQLAHQLFCLESSRTIYNKSELRKIYQEQILLKNKQIQQYNNAFKTSNALRQAYRLNG